MALIAGLVTWIAGGDDEVEEEAGPVATETRIVEAAELSDAAAELDTRSTGPGRAAAPKSS